MRYYLKGHVRKIDAMTSFETNDQTYLASGSSEGLIVWDTYKRSMKKINNLKEKKWGTIVSIVAIANKRQLAGSLFHGNESSIFVWDLESESIGFKLEGHEFQQPFSPLISLPSGDLVSAMWKRYYSIIVWNLHNRTIKHRLDGHSLHVSCLVALNEINKLASGSHDRSVIIWDLNDGIENRLSSQLLGHTDIVRSMVLLKSSGDLASGSNNEIIIWNMLSWQQKNQINAVKSAIKFQINNMGININAMTILKNGDLVTGSENGTITVWDVNEYIRKYDLYGHKSSIMSLVVLAGGELASSSADDNDIIVFV